MNGARLTWDRDYCHTIARDCLIQGLHEQDRDARRAFYGLSRQWLRMAGVARRNGPVTWRPRSLTA